MNKKRKQKLKWIQFASDLVTEHIPRAKRVENVCICRLAPAKVFAHSLVARRRSICVVIDSEDYTHRLLLLLSVSLVAFFFFLSFSAVFRMKVLLSHHIWCILISNNNEKL